MKDDFFKGYADAVIKDSDCVDSDCTDIPAVLETSVGMRFVNLGDESFPISIIEKYASAATDAISDTIPLRFSFDPGEPGSIIFFIVIDNLSSDKFIEVYPREDERILFKNSIEPFLDIGKCAGYANTETSQGNRKIKRAFLFIPDDLMDHSELKNCVFNFTYGASGMFDAFDDLTISRDDSIVKNKNSDQFYPTQDMALLKFHYDFAAQSTPDITALLENYCSSQ